MPTAACASDRPRGTATSSLRRPGRASGRLGTSIQRREHAAVLSCLRDASRRFSLDTDRVFLSGHGMGGDAAWDIGLAHPDLWAGVMPIVAVADYGPQAPKYISQYWENARYVPLYFVAGELDGDKTKRNGRDFDRYMTRPHYDVLVVEYIGRGQEHFYEEIHRLFTWMGLHRRDLAPEEFACVSMRPFDNFFWCLEVDQLPERSLVLPLAWPAPPGTRPATTEFRKYVDNRLNVNTGATQATLWLAPPVVDLNRPLEITVNGRTRTYRLDPSMSRPCWKTHAPEPIACTPSGLHWHWKPATAEIAQTSSKHTQGWSIVQRTASKWN